MSTDSGILPAMSIIIVNWNTRDLLAACLTSVVAGLGNLPHEVIVLDNASTDASATMVRARFPQVRLLESSVNLGFARGNNTALREAHGATLLLLNPDTVIIGDALQRLHECLTCEPTLAAVAPQLTYPDGAFQSSWGDFPSLVGELPWLRRLVRKRPPAQELNAGAMRLFTVDWAKGACLLIRRSAFEEVGGLDEAYWLYTEEADWCYRARAMGWTIGALPDAQVMHVEQAASRQNAPRSLIQYHRSRAIFLRKHASPLAAWGLWWICGLKAALYVIAPGRSPLGKGRNDLNVADVQRAYRGLLTEAWHHMLSPHAAGSAT